MGVICSANEKKGFKVCTFSDWCRDYAILSVFAVSASTHYTDGNEDFGDFYRYTVFVDDI